MNSWLLGRGGCDERQPRGAALLLTLLVCLGTEAVILTLAGIMVVGDRALDDEQRGRSGLSAADVVLATLAEDAGREWTDTEVSDGSIVARAQPAPEDSDRLMAASADPVKGRGWSVSARMEMGRDGPDLPVAAVVAHQIAASPERERPVVESPFEEGAVVATVEPVDPLATLSGCRLRSMADMWRLDEGWGAWVDAGLPGARSKSVSGEVAIVWLDGRGQGTVRVPAGVTAGRVPDRPVLLLATGGADLDLSFRGDLYGMAVVDGGGVLLDGTVVHGGIVVSGTADFGDTGCVVFGRAFVRACTDRSLERVRLVPGSRVERFVEGA